MGERDGHRPFRKLVRETAALLDEMPASLVCLPATLCSENQYVERELEAVDLPTITIVFHVHYIINKKKWANTL